jgi:drug/metabolite transporter (DMT)-like permease
VVNSNRTVTAALVGLGAVWGSAFVLIKVVLDEIEPTEVVFGRMALGAVVVVAVMLAMRRRPQLAPRAVGAAGLLGLFDAVIPHTLVSLSSTRIEGGIASVLVSTMPLFTTLIAAIFAHESANGSRICGLLAGFLGVVVLTEGRVVNAGGGDGLAMLAVLAAAASYAVGAVYARHLLRSRDALELTGSKLALSAFMALALTALTGGAPDYGNLSVGGWLALLGLGVVATGVAFLVFMWIVRQAGSVNASMVTYIVPVFGLLSGWIALDEEISPMIGLGALLIFGGVALARHPAPAPVLRPLAGYRVACCESPAHAA